MNSASPRTVVWAGWVLLLGAGGALGQDWPQWRGANRDGKATGFTAPKTWPKELTQKWKVPVGDGVATPALVGDRLYAVAEGERSVRVWDLAALRAALESTGLPAGF